mmetsp:Transcript_20723/g.34286  ORF Transcript_20723/g.34286 Transcript_20723/m.34286 type:complete len:254 (-) Transcript_20723:123-884(-)
MGFGAALTAASVAEYVAQPFIRKALLNPRNPKSVLGFFLGIDYDSILAEKELQSGNFMTIMSPFWFGGHVDYDGHCSAFKSLIQEAGRKELCNEECWTSTVNGQVAQLILCDQLSRNVFRGSDEAFAYDETSLDITKLLASDSVFSSSSSSSLDGIFYPAYSTFMVTALMHSEDLADHKLCLEILDWAKDESPQELQKRWDGQMSFLLGHTEVLERFGRYPHRNANKGRESTKAELEWLANVEELPGWAKSQL